MIERRDCWGKLQQAEEADLDIAPREVVGGQSFLGMKPLWNLRVHSHFRADHLVRAHLLDRHPCLPRQGCSWDRSDPHIRGRFEPVDNLRPNQRRCRPCCRSCTEGTRTLPRTHRAMGVDRTSSRFDRTEQ